MKHDKITISTTIPHYRMTPGMGVDCSQTNMPLSEMTILLHVTQVQGLANLRSLVHPVPTTTIFCSTAFSSIDFPSKYYVMIHQQ